jgi:chemotaxis protein MotB
MAGKEQSIVIKKVKQGGHGGAHGGAWKVAYADFVTAMMCFFLVMWLMGSDEETKALIEHYFNHPNTPYNIGRDPSSDMSRPLGEEEGSGASILRGTDGVMEEQNNPSTARAWEIEHGNWRVKLEELLKQSRVYGLQSNSESVKFSIPQDLIFVNNTATLAPTAAEHLDRIAKAVLGYKGSYLVTSHTADRRIASDEFPSNWDLCSARSTTILRYFIEKHRFNPKKLAAIGFADQRPLFDNNDDVNRGRNTRIEFVLSRRAPGQ